MSNTILEDDKTYDHQESVNLLEEVRNFFQGKMKMVGIEWTSDRKTPDSGEIADSGEKTDYNLQMFKIQKGARPPYEACNGIDDVEKILNQFYDGLEKLLNSFDALIDHNPNLDAESKDSLESYDKAIEKASAVFENQRKRRISKLKELSTVDEVREELRHFLGEFISNQIIQVLMDALYERIKNQAGEVYVLAVNEINQFLAANGIYTKEICLGEVIDPEFVEPTIDSAQNITDDYTKYETIDEVRRYPYLFTDETKILDGSAKVWRQKD